MQSEPFGRACHPRAAARILSAAFGGEKIRRPVRRIFSLSWNAVPPREGRRGMETEPTCGLPHRRSLFTENPQIFREAVGHYLLPVIATPSINWRWKNR